MTTNTQEYTYTITEALAVFPEDLKSKPLEEVQAIADALATSTAKKAKLKLDLVIGTLEARRKEAKKSGDSAAEQDVKAIENSLKKKPRSNKPKKVAPKKEEPKQEELPLEEKPEEVAEEPKPKSPKKAAPKKEKTEKGAEGTSDKELLEKLAALEKENAKLKNKIFPDVIERKDKAPLVAQDLPNVKDVQKILIERPLELFMYCHEGLDDNSTVFTVLFMNEEILVLLDRSRQANTTLTLQVKNMRQRSVTIDKRECPFRFYLSEKGEK